MEEVKALLAAMDEPQRRQVLAYLRELLPKHPIEDQLMISAEGMLEALARSGDFTIRMIRGIFAEGAFAAEVLPTLAGRWREIKIGGDPPYDFLLTDQPPDCTPPPSLMHPNVRVQVKMQRSTGKKPLSAADHRKTRVKWPRDHYVVEIQRSRSGERKGESTRPYRFDEFDILAVSLGPSKGRWSAFMYTIDRWLLPDPITPTNILTFQPVAPTDNDCWTNDFETAVKWLRGGENRRIHS